MIRRRTSSGLITFAARGRFQFEVTAVRPSRPTLIKLLEENEIPYEQPGRHRRVRLSDVLAYRERRRRERRARLADMTRQAAEDGLYDVSAEDYAEALKKVRGKRAD